MTRRMWVWRNGKMLEVDLNYKPPEVNAPFVMTDTIPETYCHGTGRAYTSRKERNLDMKARGVSVVDNNFRPTPAEDPINDQAIEHTLRTTLNDLRWGNAKVPEEGMLECKRMNERLSRNKRSPRK